MPKSSINRPFSIALAYQRAVQVHVRILVADTPMKSLYPSKFAMKHGHLSPLPLPGQDDRQHLHNRSACMDVPVVDVAVVASCGYTIHARFRGVDSDSFVAIKDVGSDSVFVVRWRMLSRPGPSHFKKRSGWAKHANYKQTLLCWNFNHQRYWVPWLQILKQLHSKDTRGFRWVWLRDLRQDVDGCLVLPVYLSLSHAYTCADDLNLVS